MTKRIKKKLTNEFIETLKGSEDIKVKDAEIPGFFLWYYAATGLKTFYIRYRVQVVNKEYQIRIGRYPAFKIKEARAIATEYRSIVSRGGNPVIEKRKKIIEEHKEEDKRIKLKIVLQEYLNEYSAKHKKPSTHFMDKRLAELYINKYLGEIAITELTLAHISKFNNQIGDRSKSQANHCLALISHFLNWCETLDYRPINSNPCKKVKKYKLQNRDRVLSHEEYHRLFEALEKGKQYNIYSPFAFDIIKFLALTGCRLSEAKDLTWDEVDIDNSLLRLKDSKTGAKSVPLGQAAVDILIEVRKEKSSQYVFPSSVRKGTPLVDLRRPWDFVRKEANIKDVRIHDLRHSFATAGSIAGENMAVIGKVLGHRQISTTQRYTHINNMAGIEVANNISRRIVDIAKNGEVKRTANA